VTATKILGIAGSPRLGGNTETLLDWCLAEAEAKGAEVDKFRLRTMDIGYCRACDGCWAEGKCVVGDDMQLLYPHLREADAVILAFPVYSMGVPALPKAMIDRCQPFWALKYVLKQAPTTPQRERLGAFLCCSGTSFNHVFDGTRQVVRYLWHVLDIKPAGELLCPGVDARGDILQHQGAREAAGDIGRRLAERKEAW
jgi:putative NADPH-quinone reductase